MGHLQSQDKTHLLYRHGVMAYLQTPCRAALGLAQRDTETDTSVGTRRRPQALDLALLQALVLANILAYRRYTVKKVIDFVPSRDVTYQTLPGRE
jgi:hypothetical protein